VKRRRKDSGFAMLMVFLLAAMVAITLYVEVPRVAFEAERQRELLLVDRGNQFKRAIQVFVTDKTNNTTHRYPATIEELESFNNHRYLRRRYVDPMTGKDEWRLVHINGGVLTDSVTTQGKPGAAGQGISTTSNYLSQQTFLDSTTADGNTANGGAARAMRNRPSDTAGAGGDPNNPGGAPGTPGNAGGLPGVPGSNPSGMPNTPGASGQPGIPGQPSTGQQQQPCQVYLGSCPTTTPDPSQQGQGANGAVPAGLQGGTPGGPGFAAGGGAGAGGQANGQSAAASMLNNLLTSPRRGGMPTAMSGTTIGGGLAGVASKYESEGIMVINQRTKINEWEYIFDMNKYRVPPNPVGGTAGSQQQQMGNGQNNTNNNSTPATPQSPTVPAK
jgi:hypothetical protein